MISINVLCLSVQLLRLVCFNITQNKILHQSTSISPFSCQVTFCNMKEMTTNSFLHQCTQKLNLLTLRVPKNEDKEFLDEYAIRLEVKSNQERNISYQMVYNKLVPGQHMSINDAWSAFKTSLQNYACCPNRPLLNRIDCPA